MAAQITRDAAVLPGVAEIRDMGRRAETAGSQRMSAAEIRRLADMAVERAEQVAALLRELSGLLAEPDHPGRQRLWLDGKVKCAGSSPN
jgi:hypothetical protein